MASKKPSFQFYPGDYLKDPKLSMCLPSTRGIWMDLLCAMHENDQSGEVSGTTAQLARICRCVESEMADAIRDLSVTNSANVTNCNGVVTIRCRRMWRDAEARKNGRLRTKKCRENSDKDESNKKVTLPSSSSSSEKDTNVSKKSAATAASVGVVFDEWKRVLNHPKAALDSKRKKRIQDRFGDGFTLEELKLVPLGVLNSPYHLGQNPQSTRYDGIDTVFRDRAQVEKFIELASTQPNAASNQSPEDADFAERYEAAEKAYYAGLARPTPIAGGAVNA